MRRKGSVGYSREQTWAIAMQPISAQHKEREEHGDGLSHNGGSLVIEYIPDASHLLGTLSSNGSQILELD